MPLLLYGAGRALWGPIAGALAAVAYVATPITLSYANFFALEVPTMFAMALTMFAYVRFSQTGRRRFAALSVLGMVLAASFDWTGFVFDALVLGALFFRDFVFRRFLTEPRTSRASRRFGRRPCCSSRCSLLFFLAQFSNLGQLGRFLSQGEARASGSALPLAEVLESRRYWLLLAFTPLAIVLGKLAAPVLFARASLLRREGELFPLAVLVTAVLQYVVFKQGADIHFFWPQYFALYFAYALGGLAASANEVGHLALARLGRQRFSASLTWGVLAAGLVVVGLMIPDAVRALHWARKSAGRFNEKGLIIHPDLDKAAVFAELERTLPEDASLDVNGSMKPSYWMDFTLERKVTIAGMPRGRQPHVEHAFRSRRTLQLERGASLTGSRVRRERVRPVLGRGHRPRPSSRSRASRFAGVSRRSSNGCSCRRTTPCGRWRPIRIWTWELREHFGMEPNPPPALAAGSILQRRSAHNARAQHRRPRTGERLSP